MKLVIKIGGSLCMGPNGPDTRYFRKIVPVIKKLSKKHRLAVIIGGGKFVSSYFNLIRPFGFSNDEMEWMGIELMRANQLFLADLIGGTPIFDLKDAGKRLPVIAGIQPGRSTDANAVLAAEKLKADLFLMLTDVRGVYDRHPGKRGARLLSHISFRELGKYAIKKTGPKDYGVIDPLAIKVIRRSRIRTIVFDGRDPRTIFRVLEGKKTGTEIWG